LAGAAGTATIKPSGSRASVAAVAALSAHKDRECLARCDDERGRDRPTVCTCSAPPATVEARSTLGACGFDRDRRHSGRDHEVLLGTGEGERLRGGVRARGREGQQQEDCERQQRRHRAASFLFVVRHGFFSS
jgi:hypothetical protein